VSCNDFINVSLDMGKKTEARIEIIFSPEKERNGITR
jgi:hypothetical protein